MQATKMNDKLTKLLLKGMSMFMDFDITKPMKSKKAPAVNGSDFLKIFV